MKVFFAASDPGGAHAILPVLFRLKEGHTILEGHASGPARDVFAARGIDFQDASGYTDEVVEAAMQSSSFDKFIFGTSMGETIEKKIMRSIGDRPSIAVLDFWANYVPRFSNPTTADLKLLPNRICVMDDIARDEMIADRIPADRITVTGNPHFDHFADHIRRGAQDPTRILFVSQPLRDVSTTPGFFPLPYDEYRVLAELIRSLDGLAPAYRLSIRLHPKEEAHKFDALLSSRVSVAQEATLEEALSGAGMVIGMSSPVLIQAAAAGIPAVSYQPQLFGRDPLVSNRLGVTHRVADAEALRSTLVSYVEGSLKLNVKPMRTVWPEGATERVVSALMSLGKRM